jgi:hypothetical protein
MLVGGQHRMARPYSQDLRERVVGSVASGRTCRATAALFGVSAASVVKWSQGWWASGSAAAKPMEGWRPLRLTGERAWLWARIAEKPDLTLACAGVGLYGRWLSSLMTRTLGFLPLSGLGVGQSSVPDDPRGARHQARKIALHTCIREVRVDLDHDAVMRIGGKAPRRQAHSPNDAQAMPASGHRSER